MCQQRQHFRLAGSETSRMGARDGSRSARNATRAAAAQAPGDRRSHRTRAEPLKAGQCRAERSLRVTFAERAGRFVWAGARLPELRGGGPVTGDLSGEWLGGSDRRCIEVQGLPAPVAELAEMPGMLMLLGELPDGSCLISRVSDVAGEPRGFGARGVGRRQALQRAGTSG